MKELLPVGSVVLLRGAKKKVMIIGVMQKQKESGKLYDYLGVPYPEGYISADRNLLFNQESINDVVFQGYDNPERQGFLQLLDVALQQQQPSAPADDAAPQA
ncbi:DUF4176 domain-containing protein [uncultured Gemmiger sp.]|uniref:DUF4176 domain-containing protein n=1 Tax=uncultured Gemmiger sp. TaxID=1623490 RepID=UPI0025F17DC2|nr:DUF4176 domain-containing protein [uncultured Gemmiger sp.]